MSNHRKSTIPTTAILSIIAVFIFVFLLYYFFLLLKVQLSENTTLSIINGVATTAVALVAVLNMVENRKVRSEMVLPHLSLEPTFFEYDKSGQIVGFNCLNLANGGVVARNVEIDLSLKGKTTLLYASSIGTSERVQIWAGESQELSGNIIVSLKYKNIFDKTLREELSLNMDSIKSAQRKFAGTRKT